MTGLTAKWLLVLACCLLTACSGSAGLGQEPRGLPRVSLPAPDQLAPRAASQATLNGADYDTGLPSQRVSVNGTALDFLPDGDPDAPPPDSLSYAIFPLHPADLGGGGTLQFAWQAPPESWSLCFIGLGNRDRNCWIWRAGASSLSITSLSTYANATDPLLVCVLLIGYGGPVLDSVEITTGGAVDFSNLFFLHHSTGQGIINGGVRDYIDQYNIDNGTSYEFWDHCYTWESLPAWPGGLVDADGNATGTSYGDPCDATDPWDLREIWCNSDPYYASTRNLILNNHGVIAFKSCFPAAAIADAQQLADYQTWYLEMRDVFDAHPEHIFVVMGFPPLRSEETNSADAARARQFADWLSSSTYLSGHPNVFCFNIFDALASNGSDGPANMLRSSYDTGIDSHPNELANQIVALQLAQALIDAAEGYVAP